MGHFIIDGFDFGIDPIRSSIAATDGKLNISVVGDKETIKRLVSLDDHPWN